MESDDGEEDSIDGDERANAHGSVAVRSACSLCRPASFAAALNVAKGLVLGALRSAANWSGAPRRCAWGGAVALTIGVA